MTKLPRMKLLAALAFVLWASAAMADDNPGAPPELLAAAEKGDSGAQFRLGEFYRTDGEGASVTLQHMTPTYAAGSQDNDYKLALKWYLKAADQDNDEALFEIGHMSLAGEGVPIDAKESIAWFRKSAALGNAQAEAALGAIYMDDIHGVQDFAEGVRWYRRAAKKGDPQAEIALARLYASGQGVAQDYAEAEKWYDQAAEKLGSMYQLHLAEMYLKGDGVRPSAPNAYRWCVVSAQCNLGYLVDIASKMSSAELAEAKRAARLSVLASALATPGSLDEAKQAMTPSRVNPALAYAKLLPLAIEGNPEAEYQLGAMYHAGNGLPQNYDIGLEWLKKAAEQAHAQADCDLAGIYAMGLGVTRDSSAASDWYAKAAKHGVDCPGRPLTSRLLHPLGIDDDNAEAVGKLRAAAEQGDAGAQLKLGKLYEEGKIVGQDKFQAAIWCGVAAAAKAPGASDALVGLVSVMDPAEAALARRFVDTLAPPPKAAPSTPVAAALERWRERAEAGDDDAQYQAGAIYELADDYGHAHEWYEKSAAQDNENAQLALARLYTKAGNDADALKWFRAAARQGNAQAQLAAGLLDENGKAGKTNYAEAMMFLRKAWNQGQTGAILPLARLYDNGWDVPQDIVQAYGLYYYAEGLKIPGAKAALQQAGTRLPPLQLVLAEKAAARAALDHGDRKFAFSVWLNLASFGGDAEAQSRVGRMYAEGDDYNNAMKWLLMASNKGDADAMTWLGRAYDYGKGVKMDKAEAIKWYRAAIQRGNAEAMYSLGNLYRDLNSGYTDYPQAMQWFRRAADKGLLNAQFALCADYSSGLNAPGHQGVAPDRMQAYLWCSVAQAGGMPGVTGYINSAAAQMTPEQLAAAKTLFAAWKPGETEALLTSLDAAVDHSVAYTEHKDDAQSNPAPAPPPSPPAPPAPPAPPPPPPATATLADADAAFKAKDYATAAGIWRVFADKGNAEAQFKLGRACEMGLGVSLSMTDAMSWYQKAADQGNADAEYQLGDAFKWGKNGTAKDPQEALKWYRKAAEGGSDHAICTLGGLYEYGGDVQQDFAEAIKWYRKSADAGGSCGAFMLGNLYSAGKGVAHDDEEALKWYRKSAENERDDDYSARLRLAAMYESGKGVKQDAAEATGWYQKAKCLWCIGHMYEKGSAVPKDYAAALKWYMEALEAGDTRARLSIAQLYQDGGPGLPQDDIQAYMWFTLAGAEGFDGAKLGSKMTPEQIREAKRLAKEWKPPAKSSP